MACRRNTHVFAHFSLLTNAGCWGNLCRLTGERLPISLDLESSRDFPVKETLSILIGMSRFIIADLSGSEDYRFELDAIGQSAFGAPVQPLLANSEFDTELLTNVLNYPQFLNPYAYSNEEELLDSLSVKVVDPPEDKLRSLPKRRATDGG